MTKLKIGDLEKIREKVRKTSNLQQAMIRAKVTVHMGTCGIAAGAEEIKASLEMEIARQNIKNIKVTTSGCAGLCSQEPMITIEMAGESPVKYVKLTEQKINKIVDQHIKNGEILKPYALAIGSERTV
ncbi:MAG: (2Fe-2S) ferredoxin domain-containing protein [Candidatus Aminicenantes bacterium]|nr:(2Fe-2S) ferredoxin domain-containing protein [Candidatus Aminicenantes bacterium]